MTGQAPALFACGLFLEQVHQQGKHHFVLCPADFGLDLHELYEIDDANGECSVCDIR